MVVIDQIFLIHLDFSFHLAFFLKTVLLLEQRMCTDKFRAAFHAKWRCCLSIFSCSSLSPVPSVIFLMGSMLYLVSIINTI